jgi:hypothetical protein
VGFGRLDPKLVVRDEGQVESECQSVIASSVLIRIPM